MSAFGVTSALGSFNLIRRFNARVFLTFSVSDLSAREIAPSTPFLCNFQGLYHTYSQRRAPRSPRCHVSHKTRFSPHLLRRKLMGAAHKISVQATTPTTNLNLPRVSVLGFPESLMKRVMLPNRDASTTESDVISNK